MKGQEKGQRTIDQTGIDKSEILSVPGVSQATDYLERGWHCESCHLELTPIEKLLYGDFCIFHTKSQPKPFPLRKRLYMAYLDWKTYNLLRVMKQTFKKEGYNAFYYMIGVLATLGLQHIGAAYNIDLKQELIMKIKELIEDAREGKIQKLRGSSEHLEREEDERRIRSQRGSEETEKTDIGSRSEGHAEISRLCNQLIREG